MTSEEVQPDFEWYKQQRKGERLPPRCPFISVHKCPRYYLSLSLLGKVGTTTTVDGDDQLFKRWEKSNLWPVTLEQEPDVMGSGEGELESHKSYSRFCPEVSYDAFGWFASGLYDLGDEIDRETRHRQLSGVPTSDWRWAWAALSPMHYTECPLYSMLDYRAMHSEESHADKAIQRLKNHPRWYKVVVGGIVVIGAAAVVSGMETIVNIAKALWSFFVN